MSLSYKKIQDYCEKYSSSPEDLLIALERETHLKTLAPQMLAGTYQGKLLELISKMLSPSLAVEIGTFTGYSAICLAGGLKPDGVLHTIEVNPEHEQIIRKYLALAKLENKVKLHIGTAADIIPLLPSGVDLAYVDAGKQDNELYYEMLLGKLRSGGIILIDNVLWSGKVINAERDQDTLAIQAFNEMIAADSRVENIILPIRDGITIVRKI